MKKLLMLVVFVFVAGSVFATTTTDSAQGEAKAKIIAPLEIAHVTNAALNFGTLVSPDAAGTVTISNANPGVATASGVERIAADPVSSDHFTVTNPEGVSYSVAITESSISVTNANSDTMTVSAFNPSCSSGCTATDIYVGGQLAVGADQPAGQYSGQYHITLTY